MQLLSRCIVYVHGWGFSHSMYVGLERARDVQYMYFVDVEYFTAARLQQVSDRAK